MAQASDQVNDGTLRPYASPNLSGLKDNALLAYVADLELEVDRLRKQGQFILSEACAAVKRIQPLCAASATTSENTPHLLSEIEQATKQLAKVLRDLREPSGYHPAHDQVIAVALRPLVEQVFRWQQRFLGAPEVVLRLELDSEHIEWFPARLRHILDNLIANALKYRDTQKGETRVTFGFRSLRKSYELRVSDNGQGMRSDDSDKTLELFYRSAPARAAGLGVGLAVVKLLVEQSGGTLAQNFDEGRGTTFVVVLPRYDVDDFIA